jgi:hypothetical protein
MISDLRLKNRPRSRHSGVFTASVTMFFKIWCTCVAQTGTAGGAGHAGCKQRPVHTAPRFATGRGLRATRPSRPPHQLHGVEGGVSQQPQALLNEAAVAVLGRDDVRLVAVRLVHDHLRRSHGAHVGGSQFSTALAP